MQLLCCHLADDFIICRYSLTFFHEDDFGKSHQEGTQFSLYQDELSLDIEYSPFLFFLIEKNTHIEQVCD